MNDTPEITNILRSIKTLINDNETKQGDVLELTEIAASSGYNEESKIAVEDQTIEAKKSNNSSPEDPSKNIKRLLEINNKVSSNTNNKKNKDLSALEEAIIELLKPQLATWLDANLPKIVNEIVEKEIQKLLTKNET